MGYKIDMFNYSKLILKKVSFSPVLFERELKKAISMCQVHHLEEFRIWCLKKFWGKYSKIIDWTFEAAMQKNNTALG